MDSMFQPESIRQTLGSDILEAKGSDTTSLTFYHGEYEFDLTIQKRLVPPKIRDLDIIPPLMLPGPAINASPIISLDGNYLFGEPQISESSGGVRSIFSDILRDGDSDQPYISAANSVSDDIASGSERKLHSNYLSSKHFLAPTERVMSYKQQPATHWPLSNDFNSDIPKNSSSLNGLIQNTGALLESEEMSHSPTVYRDSAFTSSDLHGLGDEVITSNSSHISFCSGQFNFSEDDGVLSQETSFSSASSSTSSNTTSTPSPSTAATTPRIAPSSPDGHICSYCHSKFTRQGDLKRHEGRHFPERWDFHCRQAGCDRRGRKGFYRRDKLMAHQRKVHGMDT